MESVLIATALIGPAVLCRALVLMTMASDLSGLSDRPLSVNHSLTVFEAVVLAGAGIGAIKRHVQLSIVGILQMVYVERGDDSSDGGNVQSVETPSLQAISVGRCY